MSSNPGRSDEQSARPDLGKLFELKLALFHATNGTEKLPQCKRASNGQIESSFSQR